MENQSCKNNNATNEMIFKVFCCTQIQQIQADLIK